MSKINKIMLAVPNPRWSGLAPYNDFPYTFGVLTSVLRNSYDIEILDANHKDLSVNEVKERIGEFSPDVFGISCMSVEFANGIKIMTSSVKSVCPEIKVVAGGIYPTLLPEVIIADQDIDYAVLGEGEYRFPKLLEHLETNKPLGEIDGLSYKNNEDVIIQGITNYIQDLDSLPLPNYDDIDFFDYANKGEKYSLSVFPREFPHAQTMTSRGCGFNCIFCNSKAISGTKIRERSPENILKEVDWLVDKYKIKELIFLDDNFYLNRKRVKKILEGLIERDYDLKWKSASSAVYALNDETLELMKESGCYQLFLAIESGSEEGQKLLRKPPNILSKIRPVIKKARSLDFEIGAMYVIGTPGETWDQIRQTIRFAEELDVDYSSFNIATPLPKTELYRIAKEKDLLPRNFDYKFSKACITTNEFTPKELEILRAFEWDRINFSTEEKRKRFAKMAGTTVREVNDLRKRTRRGVVV